MADSEAATKLQAVSRGRSVRKLKQPDWQDTNMALFGSDIEKMCKEAAADGEPQWANAGKKPGLEIWRIEQFKVKPWPPSQYGEFHRGDSYIILHTYKAEQQAGVRTTRTPDQKSFLGLAWDVHFWIGSQSTQDEYGAAAYKTGELDNKLRGGPVQHREVEGAESDLFCGYFPKGVRYLKGGVASGFNHVETKGESREPVLLQIKGSPPSFVVRQIRLKRTSMNSGDVFIMDCDDAIFQWNGSSASAHEKAKARDLALLLQQDGVRAARPFLSSSKRRSKRPCPLHPRCTILQPPMQRPRIAADLCCLPAWGRLRSSIGRSRCSTRATGGRRQL